MSTRLPTAVSGATSREAQFQNTSLGYITSTAALAVGLIHEMSQPLSAATTFVHAARRLLDTGRPDQSVLAGTMERAEQELKRVREMLVELRNVASAARHERLPVDLLELTRTIAEQLSDVAEIRAVHIRIEPGSSPTLVADAAQIKQVLLNLINNAIDAAAETSNGIVSIRCCHDGTTIEIEVNDNGMGIASEIAGHVFEPFQTTKPRGMGLGLSLSQQIVEAHGGKLWWESVAPHGTRFHLRLPFNGSAGYGN
jgi:two-component system, LuxR family, sensor kinase FixL